MRLKQFLREVLLRALLPDHSHQNEQCRGFKRTQKNRETLCSFYHQLLLTWEFAFSRPGLLYLPHPCPQQISNRNKKPSLQRKWWPLDPQYSLVQRSRILCTQPTREHSTSVYTLFSGNIPTACLWEYSHSLALSIMMPAHWNESQS